ncbi:MAG: hypothetical protein EAZ97_08545 [Bacteroidetes bacterium]|nr:MAG: hypothetical protein EAZ97_08545 [Bacteroidota bacterium]
MFLLIIFLFFSVPVYAQSSCICEKDLPTTEIILEKGCSVKARSKNCEIVELKNKLYFFLLGFILYKS